MNEYVCGGAHCKCMNQDAKCKNYHNGDHICPNSTVFTSGKQINEMKWKATMTKPLKTSDHYGCDHPDCDGGDSGSQDETYGTGV